MQHENTAATLRARERRREAGLGQPAGGGRAHRSSLPRGVPGREAAGEPAEPALPDGEPPAPPPAAELLEDVFSVSCSFIGFIPSLSTLTGDGLRPLEPGAAHEAEPLYCSLGGIPRRLGRHALDQGQHGTPLHQLLPAANRVDSAPALAPLPFRSFATDRTLRVDT